MEMRHRVVIAFLIAGIASPVWAAPNNTMSVTPSCTSGATILCSDETTRNNNISTPYNSHTHADIAAMSGVNTFTIGDGTVGNKDYCEDGTTDRCIRYNSTADLWTVQQGGTSYNQVATFSGTVGLTTNGVVLGNGTASLTATAVGSTNTVLHGNTGAAPTFSAVSLSADVTGNLGVANLGSGTGASASTFWRGDATWAAPTATAAVAGRVVRTAGDVTTTSTTLVDFTGASVTLTTGAFPVLVSWAATCNNSDATDFVEWDVDIDGTNLFSTSQLDIAQHATATDSMNCSFAVQSAALSAASHTVKLRWKVETTGTATANCSGRPCIFAVAEQR